MAKHNYQIENCRLCGSKRLYKFLSLGSMPPPNSYLTKNRLLLKENRYPLYVCLCENCLLVQLYHIVPKEIMFKNYLYVPSTSKTMMQNFQNISDVLLSRSPDSPDLPNLPDSLIIDIGSNDGSLLSFFKNKGLKVLGVDPATNLAGVAKKRGIETVNKFFSAAIARRIVRKYGRARLITSTNTFGHVKDLHDFCKGLQILLKNDGVCLLEFPYLLDLIDNNEFDTIYHEHLSYFSVTPLVALFAKHHLKILEVVKNPIHGGSLRVFLAKTNSPYQITESAQLFLQEEKLRKIDSRIFYDDFARRVKVIKRDLVNFLKKLKKEKKIIVGYGASAKGNIVLNYCNIGKETIDYVVDSITYKQGKFTPGSHLPICPEKKLLNDQPDYALLFSWNFKEEILAKQKLFRQRGGRFIITIPYLRIE